MLFVQALFILIAFDILNAIQPFRALHKTVRSWKVAEKPPAPDAVQRVCEALNYACVFYPKRALCLQRAFATTYLLRRQGVKAEMVLGAQQIPFGAHAWVEVDGRAVNERSDVQAIYGVLERC